MVNNKRTKIKNKNNLFAGSLVCCQQLTVFDLQIGEFGLQFFILGDGRTAQLLLNEPAERNVCVTRVESQMRMESEEVNILNGRRRLVVLLVQSNQNFNNAKLGTKKETRVVN